MLLRRSRLAARAARTFSSYTNVLRDRSNVLRSGMPDGSSKNEKKF